MRRCCACASARRSPLLLRYVRPSDLRTFELRARSPFATTYVRTFALSTHVVRPLCALFTDQLACLLERYSGTLLMRE